jgi:integrase
VEGRAGREAAVEGRRRGRDRVRRDRGRVPGRLDGRAPGLAPEHREDPDRAPSPIPGRGGRGQRVRARPGDPAGPVRGRPPSQARGVHELLRAAFRWAVTEELVVHDPTEGLRAIRPARGPLPRPGRCRAPARPRGRRSVRGPCRPRAGPWARAAEAVFVRRGDLVDDGLHIRGSSWGQTKTGRTRSLTLPAGEVVALRRFMAREAERLLAIGIRADDRTPILTNALGEALKPARLVALVREFVLANGIDCTYHSLRHTSASLMLASGIDVRTVAGRLGHATRVDDPGHLLAPAHPSRPGRRRAPREDAVAHVPLAAG